ncbi:MAG: hypothetical protein AAB488_00260 [Patescibacteria group bacterium]
MKKAISLVGMFALPFVVLAQSITQTGADASSVLGKLATILNSIVPILITLAVIWFFWGLITYLMGDVAEKDKGRTIMIYGVITIFVMVAVFGLVQFIATTFGINVGGGINIPRVPTSLF